MAPGYLARITQLVCDVRTPSDPLAHPRDKDAMSDGRQVRTDHTPKGYEDWTFF